MPISDNCAVLYLATAVVHGYFIIFDNDAFLQLAFFAVPRSTDAVPSWWQWGHVTSKISTLFISSAPGH
jgi:hypothetical protein